MIEAVRHTLPLPPHLHYSLQKSVGSAECSLWGCRLWATRGALHRHSTAREAQHVALVANHLQNAAYMNSAV